MVRRVAIMIALALSVSACGDDPVAPATPTVSGSWSGSINSASELNLVLSQNAGGAVTGSGNVIAASESYVVTVSSGTHVFPDLSLVLAIEGFESINLVGDVAEGRIDATLNGSGFSGETVVLRKD